MTAKSFFSWSHYFQEDERDLSMLRNITFFFGKKKDLRNNGRLKRFFVTLVYINSVERGEIRIKTEYPRLNRQNLMVPFELVEKLERIGENSGNLCGNSGESVGEKEPKNKNCKEKKIISHLLLCLLSPLRC
ncbi:MAG: hypothetical protein ACFB4I_05595 [Cyanophyceae cyanobacterium]